MSLLRTRRLVLSLTLFLFWPATAFAQTATGQPQADPPRVQIEVDFVAVSTADISRSGVVFDRVPYNEPSATESFLQYATGEFTARFLQTLRHAPGRVIQAPLITASDDVPATVQVNTQVPDRKTGFLPMQGGLTVTPRINRDGSVTLRIALQTVGATGNIPASESPATTLRTIRSGDVIMVDGLPFSPGRPGGDRRFLAFITPTLLGVDAQGGDIEQSATPSPPLQGIPLRGGKTVSIDVFNADIHAVVVLLERQFGLKALVQDSGSSYKPVYVHLHGASLAEALGAIARSAGAQIIRDESGVYVFSPLPDSARALTPAAPTGSGSSVTVTP